MSRDLRELRLRLRFREGLHIMGGLRRGLVLLQGLIVLALFCWSCLSCSAVLTLSLASKKVSKLDLM